MSDLLIKNMGIPKDKPIGVVIHPSGRVEVPDSFEASFSYPRVVGVNLLRAQEVPPHERLISADELADQYLKYLVACYPMMDIAKAKELVGAVKEAVKIAPTVLEATKCQ